MSKELIVSSTSLETKLAILEDDQVTEILVERRKNLGILGNIYKGKVTKVLPGMQAAFVDIGLERHAFLYVADFLEEIDEFGELFSDDFAGGKPAPSGNGKTRGRPAGKGPAKKRARSRPRKKAAPKKPPKTAPVPSPIPSPEEMGSILPTRLDLEGPLLSPSSEQGEFPVIMPARLSDLSGTQKASKPSRDGEAAFSETPDRPRLAVRTGGRRNSRRNSRGKGNQPPIPIRDLLREGQEILVQIAKEPIGKKGARITSHIALPGRMVVLMPTVDHVGVSRKIEDDGERQRLREIVTRLKAEEGKGFIVRTAGEGHDEADLAQDMGYLLRVWEQVRQRAEKRSAPALIHSEPNLLERVIRDYMSSDFRAIRVDDERQYEAVLKFVSTFNPEMVKRVRLYNRKTPIFDEFGVTAEIERALKHKVWLKNGGHIVINQTEALVAIDVNTGKYVGKTNSLEETITKTNLGAVRELVRQIRLRDLGGIIVVDFIDMDEPRNRQKVLEALQMELAKDKAPSKILRFNEFGLVAITRRRVKQSLEKALCQPCIFCSGTGMTKSARTIAYSIHDEVRRMMPYQGDGKEMVIRCHPEIARVLRTTEKEVVKEIEGICGRPVTVSPDPLVHIEHFAVSDS